MLRTKNFGRNSLMRSRKFSAFWFHFGMKFDSQGRLDCSAGSAGGLVRTKAFDEEETDGSAENEAPLGNSPASKNKPFDLIDPVLTQARCWFASMPVKGLVNQRDEHEARRQPRLPRPGCSSAGGKIITHLPSGIPQHFAVRLQHFLENRLRQELFL